MWPAEDDISIPEAKRNPVSEAKGAGAQRSGTTRLSEVTTATCPRRRSRSGVRRWLTTHHSPLTNQQKRWRSMKAKSFHYSFRFVFFWNEYPRAACAGCLVASVGPGRSRTHPPRPRGPRSHAASFGDLLYNLSVVSLGLVIAAAPGGCPSGACRPSFADVPEGQRDRLPATNHELPAFSFHHSPLTTHKLTEEMALDEG